MTNALFLEHHNCCSLRILKYSTLSTRAIQQVAGFTNYKVEVWSWVSFPSPLKHKPTHNHTSRQEIIIGHVHKYNNIKFELAFLLGTAPLSFLFPSSWKLSTSHMPCFFFVNPAMEPIVIGAALFTTCGLITSMVIFDVHRPKNYHQNGCEEARTT